MLEDPGGDFFSNSRYAGRAPVCPFCGCKDMLYTHTDEFPCRPSVSRTRTKLA